MAQDTGEPSGNFPVSVLQASFPSKQHIALTSSMAIAVRNAGPKAIPNISVTVKCGAGVGGSFNTTTDATDVADASRPQFAVDKIPTLDPRRPSIDPAPLERSSVYVETYPLGQLASGKTVTFRWTVTAVKAGSYRLCWRVNAGLYGKAKATRAPGSAPVAGVFSGNVSDAVPQATIGPDGQSVVNTGR